MGHTTELHVSQATPTKRIQRTLVPMSLQAPRATPIQRIQRTLIPMSLQAPRATGASAAPRPHTDGVSSWLSAPSQWREGKGRKSAGRDSPAAGS